MFLKQIIILQFLSFHFGITEFQEFDTSSVEIDNSLEPDRTLSIQPPEPPENLPPFATVAVKSLHLSMFTKVFNLLLDKGIFYNSEKSRSESPYNWECPECLLKKFNFTVGEVGESNQEVLLEYLQEILYYSPKQSHPFYLGKSGNGLDPYALVADWLATTVNSVTLTYFLSPVASLMEIEMVKKLCELIGYPPGEGDGDITPGNTISNLMAIQLALGMKFPDFKELGYIGANVPKFGIFISTSAITTMGKTQSFMGFPKTFLIKINVDTKDRMDPSHLEEEIIKAQNNDITPLMVFAMAGTPNFGGISGLEQIGEICKKYNVWFHVDAIGGGGCLFSEKQRWRLKGIEMTDSVSFSTSKLLGSLHTSTFLLTRHTNALTLKFQNHANYVFRKSGLYNSTQYDRGDSTIQTSRRPEIMKSWFLWKAKGQKGLGAHIDRIYENLEYILEEMKNRIGFKSVLENYDTPIVVFHYIPKSPKYDDKSEDFIGLMNNFTVELQQTLLTSGNLALSTIKLNNSHVFLTLKLGNSVLTKSDINYILDSIAYYGEKISGSGSEGEEKAPPTIPVTPSEHPSFVSAPIESLHKEFITKAFQLFLKRGIFFQNKRKESPYHFRIPEELIGLVDLSLGEDPLSQSEVLKQLEIVINYTPHFSHPFFSYQLMAGLNPYSLLADYIASAVNAPQIQFEDSPMATIMEQEVLKKLRQMYGYINGSGDGTVTDGGSLCNMMGMGLGRFSMFHDFARIQGNYISSKQLVLSISEDAHYSFNKGAFVQGYGTKNVFPVKTDERGRMIPDELRKAIKKIQAEGKVPFMVAATAGTTIYGAIDPINEIADICKEFKLWFHVDGVFGGSIMMSSKYKSRINGIERSDSMCVNFHKMFGGAHTMSIFLTKYPGIMNQAFGSQRLNKDDPIEPYNRTAWDDGEKRFISLKRANIFKIWFLLKALGREGLGNHIDYIYDRCNFLVEKLKSMPEKFVLVLPEYDITNILFYYIPKRLRETERDKKFWNEIDKVSIDMSVLLVKKGILNILAQNRNRGDPSFLKFVIMSSGITDEDINYFLQVIDFYGQDL